MQAFYCALAFLGFLVGIGSSCAQDPSLLHLVRQGKSEWKIVLPQHADPLEQEAAERLREKIQAMTGASLPIVAEESILPPIHSIFIGNTQAFQHWALPSTRIEVGGFLIAAAGNRLFLCGDSPKTTDYAVSSLLEVFGCRFWAPGALEIPRRLNLVLKKSFCRVEVPPTPWRSVHYGVAADPEYRRWHKLDWVGDEIPDRWAPYWVHSFLSILPPSQFFDEHPEYFALVDGKRRPTQLCMANPDVLRKVEAYVQHLIEQNPKIQVISLSQADNVEPCQCRQEKELTAREGSAMAPVLRFVNTIARKFQQYTFSTLAYQYTRKPPRNLQPEENVRIMLCTIEADRSRPLSAQTESRFADDFQIWSARTSNIFLWDYEVQFTNLLAPFPDLYVLQPNVQWLSQRPLQNLFLQGNGVHTEFSELRCYLLAKLAWNPQIDFEATLQEFLAGFYGDAAPYLSDYIHLLHKELGASASPLRIFGSPIDAKDSWLRPQVLARAEKLFAEAKMAVRGKPTLARRLSFAFLPVQYAELECARSRGANANGIWQQTKEGNWQVVPAWKEKVREFLAVAAEAKQKNLREWGLSLKEYGQLWGYLLHPTLPQHRAFQRPIKVEPRPVHLHAENLCDALLGGDRADDGWVQWKDSNPSMVLDLWPDHHAPAPQRLRISCLQDRERSLLFPQKIVVSISDDGEGWHAIQQIQPVPAVTDDARQAWTISLPQNSSYRFLRLEMIRPHCERPHVFLALDELLVDGPPAPWD